LSTIDCAGQKPDAGEAGYFLKLAANARILGMGGAGVACPDSNIFINTAGIAATEKKKLQLTTIALPFPDTSYNYLNYTQPVGENWGIGLGMPVLKVTGAEKRTGEYESYGTFDDQNIAFGLGIARTFPLGFSAGLTLKAIQQRFCEKTTSSGDIDLGLLYQHKPYHALRRGNRASSVSFGVSFQNILGSTVEKDKMPLIINAGISYRPSDKMLLSVEIEQSNKQATRLHLGGEYCPMDILSLRLGHDDQGYLTTGVGIRLHDFTVDYGLQNHTYKLSHRVSVGVVLGK
jgi:hypothetical protein